MRGGIVGREELAHALCTTPQRAHVEIPAKIRPPTSKMRRPRDGQQLVQSPTSHGCEVWDCDRGYLYNFDETGFQMGVIVTPKVVTQTKRPTPKQPRSNPSKSDRPMMLQPGDRNWVTVIEGINASGWALPPTVIFEGKVHQSSWYRTWIPPDWGYRS
jgi:hypothetical protein